MIALPNLLPITPNRIMKDLRKHMAHSDDDDDKCPVIVPRALNGNLIEINGIINPLRRVQNHCIGKCPGVFCGWVTACLTSSSSSPISQVYRLMAGCCCCGF